MSWWILEILKAETMVETGQALQATRVAGGVETVSNSIEKSMVNTMLFSLLVFAFS